MDQYAEIEYSGNHNAENEHQQTQKLQVTYYIGNQ
jgi:hypothetical protein